MDIDAGILLMGAGDVELPRSLGEMLLYAGLLHAVLYQFLHARKTGFCPQLRRFGGPGMSGGAGLTHIILTAEQVVRRASGSAAAERGRGSPHREGE